MKTLIVTIELTAALVRWVSAVLASTSPSLPTLTPASLRDPSGRGTLRPGGGGTRKNSFPNL